jgi:hypothetical protein
MREEKLAGNGYGQPGAQIPASYVDAWLCTQIFSEGYSFFAGLVF